MKNVPLFEVEETLSPRLAWVKKRDIRFHHATHLRAEDCPWCAWLPENEDSDGMPRNPDAAVYEQTKKAAIDQLAKECGELTWPSYEAIGIGRDDPDAL